MRSVKGDVHEEGVVGFLRHPEIVDGVVADDFTPVFSAFPEAAELHVERAPLVGLSFNRPVVSRFCLLRHSAANVASDFKGFRRVGSDVPLSGEECLIANRLQKLRPHPAFLSVQLIGFCMILFRVPQPLSADEHHSTGHADRAVPAAHVVRMSERRPGIDEAIQVRRLNLFIASRVDRVEALVVGKNEQDVRLVRGLRLQRGAEQNQSDDQKMRQRHEDVSRVEIVSIDRGSRSESPRQDASREFVFPLVE